MATIIDPPNSVWPNGLKVDSEGYVTFYSLGTNKVDISTITWPDGDKLVSPFVYQNDKLVGFVDTKALTVSGSATTTMNYSHIEADFSSISEGKLTVNTPNAIVKKFIWGIADSGDNVIVTIKYKGCTTTREMSAVDSNYLTNDIVDGVWSEGLEDLVHASDMFNSCESLVSFSSNLSSLIYADNMFRKCTNLTSFSADLPNLTTGNYMFAYSGIESFSSNLSNLNSVQYMFMDCSNLTSFSAEMNNLTNGGGMFYNCKSLSKVNVDLDNLTEALSMFNGCSSLTSFDSDLSKLTNGKNMFYGCSGLTSFDSDLSSLTNGYYMFYNCSSLTSFNIDMPKLTEAKNMFQNCTNLTSFDSDLSSLTDGYYMFNGCSSLTSFSSDLPKLTDGRYMFRNAKLDAPSVKNIIDTINTYSGSLMLGMGCKNTTEDKNIFAQEVGYADMTSLQAALQAKGWTVSGVYNGRPTTTYGLRKPSENTLPIFVQLEEIEEYADYTSMDGSKKYRLNYFHETTGSTEGYTQFNSLEEAVEHFNIKPIERN